MGLMFNINCTNLRGKHNNKRKLFRKSSIFILKNNKTLPIEGPHVKLRFLCTETKAAYYLQNTSYDEQTTIVVTTDVAASRVKQRFTYYTSNLTVF